MKNNRFLKVLAIVMSVFMIMTAIAIPAFADDEGGNDSSALVPVPTDNTYDVWDGTFDTSPYDAITDKAADRSSAEPIIIDTAEKLAGLAKATNDAGIYNNPKGAFLNQKFYITKNIDLKCFDFPIIGMQYDKAQFSGIIEGRLDGVEGKAITIANLSIPQKSGNNAGFIGTLRGGGVKNLTFVNANVGNRETVGGTGIVCGYISKNVVAFENITIVDSKVTAGENSYTGYLVGVCKTDHAMTFKNCAVINSSTVIPTDAESGKALDEVEAGGLVGYLQKNKTNNDYGFENCSISGATTLGGFSDFAGFVAKFDSEGYKLTIKNCHYNADLTIDGGKADDVYPVGIIASNCLGAQVEIDGLLITGHVPTVDGKMPLIGTAALTSSAPLKITAKNVYATSDNVVAIGANEDECADTVSVTVVTAASITGSAASTTLADLDFENVWTVRDGKVASLKVAEADTYAATAPVIGGGDSGDSGNSGNSGDNSDNSNTPVVTQAPTGDNTDDDGGCGSVVSATCLVTLLTVGMGVTVIRKKRD